MEELIRLGSLCASAFQTVTIVLRRMGTNLRAVLNMGETVITPLFLMGQLYEVLTKIVNIDI